MAQIDQARFDRAVAALDRVRQQWLRRPGVAAVDVGFPLRGNAFVLDEVAVRVHVQRKIPVGALPPGEAFNDSEEERSTLGDDVPVDVIEARYAATAAESRAPAEAPPAAQPPTCEVCEVCEPGAERDTALAIRRGRVAPLMGGVSVGNPRVSAGTIGAIVWDTRDGSPHLLSNWHVLAGSVPAGCCGASGNTQPEPHYHALAGPEPHYHATAGPEPHYHSGSPGAPHLQAAAVGEPIYQPGRFDGGTAADTVAHLSRLRLDRHMDAAIARLDGRRPYAADILGLAPCREHVAPRLGMQVRKSGRSTGTTPGMIDGLSLSTVISYPHGPHAFDDQIHIVPRAPWPDSGGHQETSEPGDSGALWVEESTGHAVGLHFGGDVVGLGESEHSLANPIGRVLDALEVSLIPTLHAQEAGPTAAAPEAGVGRLVDAVLRLAASGDGASAPGTRCPAPSPVAQLEALRDVIDRELHRFG